MFSTDRSYVLRINVDPRLFLSDQPTTLPPVPIEWYRDQTPADLAQTERLAGEYLRRALKLQFGDESLPLPKCAFTPMDGATNMPVGAETKEVHLLAEAQGKTPENENTFQLLLTREANTSMILLNSFDGQMERRPNAVFPGESSRPFLLAFPEQEKKPVMDPFAKEVEAAKPGPQPKAPIVERRPSRRLLFILPAGAAAAAIAIGWLLFARKKRG